MAFCPESVMQFPNVKKEFALVTDPGSAAIYTMLHQIINGKLPPL
jgi:hypothetical protein